jgi:hypothetical protein
MSSSTVSKLLGRSIQEADAHQRTQAHADRSKLRSLIYSFDRFAKEVEQVDPEIGREVAQLRQKLVQKLEGVKSAKTPATAPQGATTPTSAQIRRAITNGTGLSGWKPQPTDPEYVDSVVDNLSDEYDLQVDPKQVKMMSFTRETDDRSELFYLVVAAVPGGVYLADWATDRVSGSGDLYKSVEQFEKELSNL